MSSFKLVWGLTSSVSWPDERIKRCAFLLNYLLRISDGFLTFCLKPLQDSFLWNPRIRKRQVYQHFNPFPWSVSFCKQWAFSTSVNREQTPEGGGFCYRGRFTLLLFVARSFACFCRPPLFQWTETFVKCVGVELGSARIGSGPKGNR